MIEEGEGGQEICNTCGVIPKVPLRQVGGVSSAQEDMWHCLARYTTGGAGTICSINPGLIGTQGRTTVQTHLNDGRAKGSREQGFFSEVHRGGRGTKDGVRL